MASPATEVDAGGRAVRVSSPDRVIYEATEHTAEVTKLEVVEYYLAVGDGIMRALRERPTALERWPKGVREGIVLEHAGRRQGRRVLPEAGPQGRARRTSRPPRSPSPPGRTADEICPTELAVPAWAAQMGTLTFHPWPVRRSATSTTPTSCGSTSTRSGGTDVPRRGPGRRRRAGAARRARPGRLPEDQRQPRRARLRPDRAAVGLRRRAPRRHRVRARARATYARGDHQVVEGGARRRDLRRLQPEQPRPDDRLGLQPAAQARRAGVARRWSGTSSPRSRTPRGYNLFTVPGAVRRARRRARGDRRRALRPRRRCSTCSSSRGSVELPYPPDYPKMPGEPPRVQPSKKVAAHWEDEA